MPVRERTIFNSPLIPGSVVEEIVEVTPAEIGLGNVDNTSDTTKGNAFGLGLTRAQIPTVTITRASFVLTNGAPYVLGASTDFLAIQDAAGTWFKLDVSGGFLRMDWIGMVPNDASPGTASANVTAINGAMRALSTVCQGGEIFGSGYYYVNGSVDNRYPRVLVRGPAPDFFHDVGTAPFGLTFAGLGSITVLRHRTPTPDEAGVTAAQNQRISGGGFRWVTVVGGARCLHVTSTGFGEYDVATLNATGTEAVLFDCLPDYRRPDVSQMGEASDTQYARINLVMQQDGAAGTTQADCLVFSGYAGCGNPSYIFGARVAARHANGVGLRVKNGDNIVFESYRSTQVGGSGGSFRIEAPVLIGDFAGVCDAVEFNHYGSNASGYVEGTADRANAVTPAQLTIWKADASNGTPAPGSGLDAYIKIHEINGLMFGLSMAQGVMGESLANAFQGRLRRRSGNSLHVYNGSEDHVTFDNGTIKYNATIEAATGAMRWTNDGGTGVMRFPRVQLSALIDATSDQDAFNKGVRYDELYLNTTSNAVRPQRFSAVNAG